VLNPYVPAGSTNPPASVFIYTPTGGAGAPTGGHCDAARRPTVFIGHGFGNSDPATYADLITHLVSVGNVVVYPSYDFFDGTDRSALEESYRQTDAGIVAAVAAEPRIDRSRVGWWGHSHGGGMIPWLVQQGVARRWGTKAVWMSAVAPAYSQLVGDGAIAAPRHARAMVVAFEHDQLADARLGIDMYLSLSVPHAQKWHVTVNTDPHGQPAYMADHGSPAAEAGKADAVDATLWRYADLLERCSLAGNDCDADLSFTGTWADGVAVVPATVAEHPVDVGPYPALLAECDAAFGPSLNPRIARCGPTHL
jgi:hypothetical protein